jgi:hypothetical protein
MAVETAVQNPKDCSLKLCGIQDLSKINEQLAKSVTEANLFKNIFSLNDKFFYIVEKIDSRGATIFRERGIAHLYIDNDEYYIVRCTPIMLMYPDGSYHQCNNKPSDLYCSVDEKVVISSSFPASHAEVLHTDNCLLGSSEAFTPKAIKLDENCIVGRLKDEIRQISFDDFSSIEDLQEAIVSSLSKYSKQIELSSSKLSMKHKRSVISSNVFQLRPTSNPPSKAGTLIFDESSNSLKFYDGQSWYTLNSTKDNE